MIVAVDFDGTLCENRYPEIGDPNTELIDKIKRMQAFGDKFILWTCREGRELNDAVNWCLGLRLRFDAINENLPERIERFQNDCRKIGADEYWDDKAVKVVAEENNVEQLYVHYVNDSVS